MKIKKTLSLLCMTSALTAISGIFSDSRAEYEVKNAQKDAELKEDLTLVGKTIIPETWSYDGRAYLYFSATENTNKIDVVAVKNTTDCLTAKARVFEAKIGDKKKISAWRQQLSHKFEDNCGPIPSATNKNRSNHDFYWERVKE